MEKKTTTTRNNIIVQSHVHSTHLSLKQSPPKHNFLAVVSRSEQSFQSIQRKGGFLHIKASPCVSAGVTCGANEALFELSASLAIAKEIRGR
jgi:hypothetical protein